MPPASAPTAKLPPMVAAMLRAETYPDHPAAPEFRQTHISQVFLAGEFVYKIKKPVRFAFVDASTLERRRLLCLDEVRLNRRLAPAVYLGVLPILLRHGRFRLGALQGESADA